MSEVFGVRIDFNSVQHNFGKGSKRNINGNYQFSDWTTSYTDTWFCR